MKAPVGRQDFAVRQDGCWWLTPVPGSSSTAVELDELLGVIDAAGSAWCAHSTDVANATAKAGDDTMVGVAWSIVGRACGHGLVVREGGAAGEVLLDRDDLRLIDAMAEATTVISLRERTGIRDVDARVSRLIRHGLLHLVDRSVGGDTDASPAFASEPDPGTPDAARSVVGPRGGPVPPGPEGRIPVYAIWHEETGPLLALGMLTASARTHDGGRLNETFEIRRPETRQSMFEDIAKRPGPAVLLCSDYVWSLENNLAAAHRAVDLNPDVVVIHGGPSSPKYEDDATRFLDENGDVAHVLVRNEGELVICELLKLLEEGNGLLDTSRLSDVRGLTYRDATTGEVHRTAEPARIDDLDSLTSPYLTGEFDHIPVDRWLYCLSIETNRGCPYSCTYCDWGSSTLSRIRKFSLERVDAEMRWAAERGVVSVNLPDANFGILARDAEVVAGVVELRRELGFPRLLSFYPAKNTTKHLIAIMDTLVEGDVGTTASISLQTTDPTTLDAIKRSNISTDHYVALAAGYRRRGFPIQGDLLIGLPGQTYDSYRRDLQFNIDHEIQARTWQLSILPNAPMNEPSYRERFKIVSDEHHHVRSTSTFTEEDRRRMLRLRNLDIISERLGLLRHVLRWVQWERDIPFTIVLDRVLDLVDSDPLRYPALTWVVENFENHATAPLGWDAFYGNVRRLLAHEFGIGSSSGLETALTVNQFLMAAPGRSFPATIDLAHDYVAYYRDATTSLYTTGVASGPVQSLESYGPASLTVSSDPLRLCTDGLRFPRPGEDESMESDFSIGANTAHELVSPLVRLMSHLVVSGITVHDLDPGAAAAQGLGFADDEFTEPVADRAGGRPGGYPEALDVVTKAEISAS